MKKIPKHWWFALAWVNVPALVLSAQAIHDGAPWFAAPMIHIGMSGIAFALMSYLED